MASTLPVMVVACGNHADLVLANGDPRDAGADGRAAGRGGGSPIDIRDSGRGAVAGYTPQSCEGGSGEGCVVVPACGNHRLDTGETCDDGNVVPGDGCDGTCQKEGLDWSCPAPGVPCSRVQVQAVCGDGVVALTEQCDLGTNVDGGTNNDGEHGCSSTCQLVPGWGCPSDGGTCLRACGDGVVQPTLGEQCDDGLNDGTRGCTTACKVVVGWRCPPEGGVCTVDVYCGNGVVENFEQCDDHNRRSYDGCSATCFLESGWSCPSAGGACGRICGNGRLDTGEACDDGNVYSGDGCSSSCQSEANYTCYEPGHPCVYTPPPPPPGCGNGAIETGEQCDDGNVRSGDGCSSACQIQPGWSCSAAKQACVAAQCGDGIVAGAETCDDGNNTARDGCSATCALESNAVCPETGGICVPMRCGDGIVTGSEQCDDGNANSADGCSSTCVIEPGWRCPLPAVRCVAICGDGLVQGAEQCDEGADVACCTANCKLKPGYVCDPSKTPHSQLASAYCGNGTIESNTSVIRGPEQCDDGNLIPFDGCSPTCKNEPQCGTLDVTVPGARPVPYQCFVHCGDGLQMQPEQCDDGNIMDGDGCDHACKVEVVPGTSQPAWNCVQPPAGPTVSIPVIWRDFTPRSHPQFEIDARVDRRLPGIAQDTLQQVPDWLAAASSSSGSLRRRYIPTYNPAFRSPSFGTGYQNIADWTMNGAGWTSGSDTTGLLANAVPAALAANATTPLQTPAGRYAQWYVDDPTVNKTYTGAIALKETPVGSGTYQYSCDNNGCDSTFTTDPPNAGTLSNRGFYPLDGRGWVATQPAQETKRNDNHNYHFTTEARYWFVFRGGEQLQFYGDDDVWVFVNGGLALDLGGIHNKLNGYFVLNDDGSASSCAENTYQQWGNPPQLPAPSSCPPIELGLQKGIVYEVAVFHAERHVIQSNFRLTLRGFNGSPSVCTPICGDGFVAGDEQCDRGAANVNPRTGDAGAGANGTAGRDGSVSTYGQCTTECKLGPFCGDALKQEPREACDNGVNNTRYTKFSPGAGVCAPLCQLPAYCGDGVTQSAYGEECDDPKGNQDAYGRCQTNCLLGPRCGDGHVQSSSGEMCDDGPNNGSPSSACTVDCRAKCGNGTIDSGEECDEGAQNGGGTSLCGRGCQWKCGNGQLDPGEECDNGKNDGAYGTCNADCTMAPYCGDGTIQTVHSEICDNGLNNRVGAYGPGSCSDQCLPGGTCGDGIVNGNERCDDGVNSGQPGSCLPDCSAYVPSARCGDGVRQDPELCDDGAQNGTKASACDSSCRRQCGNAILDPGEQCDNGVNDGSYGTCRPDCTLAGYCGDGVKNGAEQCDHGPENAATASAYGAGICTTACSWAPFCGDGYVQPRFGEQCEGSSQCANCMWTVPPVR